MKSCNLNFKETSVTVSPLEDGLFAIQVNTETDSGYGKPKEIEIVVDTKYDCVLTGPMSNMLLHVLQGRREKDG